MPDDPVITPATTVTTEAFPGPVVPLEEQVAELQATVAALLELIAGE